MNKDTILKSGLRYGINLGLIQIMVALLLYLMGVEYMVKWWVGLLNLVVIIGLLVYFGKKWRSSVGGFSDFKSMYMLLLSTHVVSLIIATVFNLLMYNVIDTNLAQNMEEHVIKNTVEMMENFGAPEESIEQTIVGLETFAEKFSVLGMLEQLFWSVIVGAILLTIPALILKKKDDSLELEENLSEE